MNWKIIDGSWMQSGGKATPDKTPVTETDVPSRRIVLRGALAAGCSLLLPASLLGCSKKEASTAGTEPPASSPEMATPAPMESAAPSSPAPMESAAPAAPAKVSQASVQYQTQPKDEKKCADCMNFIAESNSCKLVEGNISPNGWCTLWVKKA
ncbi:MAG: hypothetical protein Q8K12_00275 [Thiobacillus sp.]|nr:hypothetical protein [Thiobacillus sp.]